MFGLLGTLVNTGAVLAGGTIGLLFHKAIPQRLSDSVFKALGLCTLFIGVTGVFQQGINTLVVILAMVLGAVIGEAVDLDRRVSALGKRIERRFKRPDGGKVTIAEGFVSASLLFCTGAMTIVGSLQSGLIDDPTTLFTKSLLDFVASIIFASSFGFGVLFAAGFVFVYQGLIAFVSYLVRGAFVDAAAGLTADALTPFMTVVNHMNCVGYLIIIALALNMIGVTKLKVMNFVPAVFLPIGLVPLISLLPI